VCWCVAVLVWCVGVVRWCADVLVCWFEFLVALMMCQGVDVSQPGSLRSC
jgi:hypothetical protein